MTNKDWLEAEELAEELDTPIRLARGIAAILGFALSHTRPGGSVRLFAELSGIDVARVLGEPW